jgi:hypothetical protein
MLVGFCTESTKGTRQDTPPLPPTTSLHENYTVGDPMVDQPQMKKSLSFLQEIRLLTMPWESVGNQLEEEINISTTHWRTRLSLDLQEDWFPLQGDPRVYHHGHLDAAH